MVSVFFVLLLFRSDFCYGLIYFLTTQWVLSANKYSTENLWADKVYRDFC